jgi:hypothetical protein
MPDKIMEHSRAISANNMKDSEGRTCYASTTGAYSTLVTNLCIAVGVYGDPKVKAKVLEALESHLKFLQEIR